jgi:hypothetical protein
MKKRQTYLYVLQLINSAAISWLVSVGPRALVTHGVWTTIKRKFTDAGYVALRIFIPKHHQCGGRTYRNRVLILLARSNYLRHLDQSKILRLGMQTPPPPGNFDYEFDKSRDWLLYGKLVQGKPPIKGVPQNGLHLQSTTTALVPGVIVQAAGSPRLWRTASSSRTGSILHMSSRMISLL